MMVQTTEQRIDWLKRQLAQVEEFIAHGKARLALAPNDQPALLTQSSWEQLHAEYVRDLTRLELPQCEHTESPCIGQEPAPLKNPFTTWAK